MHSGSLEKEQSKKIIDILMIALGNLDLIEREASGFLQTGESTKNRFF
jgi:hypothetical protein